MYTAMFIFEPGSRDEEFERLNALIRNAANETKGYLGAETWVETNGSRINAIYYWKTLEALHHFSGHPSHREAKCQYERWYNGYHIVVSEIIKSYGDDSLLHITPNERIRAQ